MYLKTEQKSVVSLYNPPGSMNNIWRSYIINDMSCVDGVILLKKCIFWIFVYHHLFHTCTFNVYIKCTWDIKIMMMILLSVFRVRIIRTSLFTFKMWCNVSGYKILLYDRYYYYYYFIIMENNKKNNNVTTSSYNNNKKSNTWETRYYEDVIFGGVFLKCISSPEKMSLFVNINDSVCFVK